MRAANPTLLSMVMVYSGVAMAAPGGKGITTEMLLTQIYNFSLFFGILFLIVRKPVIGALKARRENYIKQKSLSQIKLKEAQDKLRDISDRTSSLEKNFSSDLARAKKEAEQFVKDQEAAAKLAAERAIAEAQRNLGFEKAKYIELLKIELLEKSADKAKDNLKKSLKSTDQKRLQTESFERFQEVRP